MFGAKRLSVVRYLKQNNKTKIASGWKLYNKVFAVTDPDKNVNLRGDLYCYRVGRDSSRRVGVVLADRFEDSRATLCRR